MFSNRCLLFFLLVFFCICTAWSQESRQREIPLVSRGSMGAVIDPGWLIRGGAAVEVVQESTNAGRYCLHITTTKRANFWDDQLIHGGHVFRKGKVYTLAAHLRSRDRLQIHFTPSMAEEPWTGYGGQSFTMTDTWQEYHLTTPPMPEDVSPARLVFNCAYGTGEFYIGSVRFYEGEYVPAQLPAVGHAQGQLLMLDDKTPHVSVPVQAVRNGKVFATALSDESGEYQLINLKSGQYQIRCQVLGGYVYYRTTDHEVTGEYDAETLYIETAETLRNINFRFAPFKKGTWRDYDTFDGLAHNAVRSICRDRDGTVWFATDGGGVSYYDGREFVNLTTHDGLANNDVRAIHRDPDGVMWFATNGGVSRYDGKVFVNLTTHDGLANNEVWAIHRDPDGVMWFGTGQFFSYQRGGVSRYDEKTFINLTAKDGLARSPLWPISGDADGIVWIGSLRDGVFRYDGKELVNFTVKDGLAYNDVMAIYCDPDGVVWFGTDGSGVSYYDGKGFLSLTTKDGLAHNHVRSIYRDPDGVMWFGTAGYSEGEGGVSQYDGKEFVNFTVKDGLAHDEVWGIYCDSNGGMWFGTDGGGVSWYDGTAWTSLDARDGLAGSSVTSIYQDPDGYFWFATDGGVTRYRPDKSKPKARIISVTADLTYRDLSNVPAFAPGTRVTIEYGSLDFKTLPEKRQYRCRVYDFSLTKEAREGSVANQKYGSPTRDTTFDWISDKAGTYTFQVQAIDRDLNYSEPASIELAVVQPLYLRAVFLIPAIGSGMIMIVALIALATALIKRRRQVNAYQQLAVKELQDAREMQMSLLPESAPPVEGMEIAGKSIAANTVGGDFFDYLTMVDGKVGIAIADVSGKGLRAALNAALASGMLYEVVKTEMSCGNILSALNAGLHPRMEKQMFTAFSFAVLDNDAGVIHWANAAQPFPLIKRGNAASEVREDGELPLGMMPDVTYPDYQLELQTGDIVIFYTDGIIEAENEAEEMYGIERLLNLVTSIDSAASAERVIEAILQDVSSFAGSAQQYDDMTVAVLKKV